MWRWRRKNELRVPASIEMDACQTRDYCIAKSATLRAVRPGVLTAQTALARMTTSSSAVRRKPRQALLDRTAEGGSPYMSFSGTKESGQAALCSRRRKFSIRYSDVRKEKVRMLMVVVLSVQFRNTLASQT